MESLSTIFTISCGSIIISKSKQIILTKAIYKFNATSIKISMVFFTELEQVIVNFQGNMKDQEQPKQSQRKSEKLEESCSLTADYSAKFWNNQSNIVLAQKQTHRSSGQKKRLTDIGNKLMVDHGEKEGKRGQHSGKRLRDTN